MGYRVLENEEESVRKMAARKWHCRTHTMTAAAAAAAAAAVAAAAGGSWMDRMGVFRQLELMFRQHAGRGVTSGRLVIWWVYVKA